jgi:hypothetical protein
VSDPQRHTIQLKGETFAVTFPVPPMALMDFAAIAVGNVSSNDLEGLAAMYELLESVVEPEDWARFKKHAKKTRATDDELWLLVRRVINGQTDHPTSPPSDSSDGPATTKPSSEPDSSSPVAEKAEEWLRVKTRLEEAGRPDKALMVLEAQEAMAASRA